MKKILILLSIAFSFACNNKEKTPNDPPAQATIAGADVNVCPDVTVTLTATAKHATSFEWRKDGIVVEGETNSTFVVSETGEYRVSGINEYGQGSLSVVKNITIVSCLTIPLQATISGNNANVCPEHSITLTATAQGATSFQWKKDGVILPKDTTSTLVVFEAGVYTVAGVNTLGMGEFSESKTVTISECIPFIDLLLGIWDAVGFVMFENEVFSNNHNLFIEKINNTTIKINNFDGSGVNNVVIATVDNIARTIHIPLQRSYTDFSWPGDETYYSLAAHPFPCQNAGDIGTLEVEGVASNLSITFPHRYIAGVSGSGPYNVTYHMLTYIGTNCMGVGAWAAETVWTKRK
ncbi:MAG: hypothetical protein LBH22_02865 [Bacteroidales bacterium]|jgi:hypothetical protein|nr:hypothetical protein [Bacteroidales bacterium]